MTIARILEREDGVRDYLETVGDHPLLTPEQERELFRRLEAGDEGARDEIVRCNLRFVVKVALRFRHSGQPLADLIQEGNLGLLQAVDRFDWRRGFRFCTYAAFFIRQEIQACIQRQSSMIRLPVRKARLMRRMNEFVENWVEQTGCEPTAPEIARGLDESVDRIQELLEHRFSFSSLDRRPGEDGFSLAESLPDAGVDEPVERIAREQSREAVRRALSRLSDRERRVIELRFGLNAQGRAFSLRNACRFVDLSQEGVRRVEQRALDKLRRPQSRASLEGLLTA